MKIHPISLTVAKATAFVSSLASLTELGESLFCTWSVDRSEGRCLSYSLIVFSQDGEILGSKKGHTWVSEWRFLRQGCIRDNHWLTYIVVSYFKSLGLKLERDLPYTVVEENIIRLNVDVDFIKYVRDSSRAVLRY